SQYAHELFHLKQSELMQSQMAAATGTPGENLWKAELILLQFDEMAKDRGAGAVTDDYFKALDAYIKSQPKGLDGTWALDHAQFILAKLSQPILTRMEYFGNNRRDRETLAPLAARGANLLQIAIKSLDASMKQIENVKPFDDKAYARNYAAAASARYYDASALYFKAMALDPASASSSAAGDDRAKVLAQAAEELSEWAVDEPDNGVNFQAYLLRGKALSEAGNTSKALLDFAKAQSEKAPNWVQFQARYQSVVSHLRAAVAGSAAGAVDEFGKAQSTLDEFRRWIPAENTEAQFSLEMLAYRVAWVIADTHTDPSDNRRARREALDKLSQMVQREPKYRDLVYEQLAAQIPENAELNSLLPLQLLALARTECQNPKTDTPEGRQHLTHAAVAALAAYNDPLSTGIDRTEATFLLGLAHALLGNLALAARYNVEFASMSPKDPRARQVIDLALQQIGELRRNAATQTAPTTVAAGGSTPATLPADLRDLAAKALDLSINTFGDTQWLYAQARLLEDSDKPSEAAAIYEKIQPADHNYLDSRYRMVVLATEHFTAIEGKAASADQAKAADELFSACTQFVNLLDHPPASAPPEIVKAALGYRDNIWLIEASAAVSPAVNNVAVALDRLGKLDSARDKLTDAQRSTILQDRIRAYQLSGQPAKAAQAVDDFANSGGEAINLIQSLALSTVDRIEKSRDAGEIKTLAGDAVILLNPIIRHDLAEGKKENAFEFRYTQAEMMVRAGQNKAAEELAVALQKENEEANRRDFRPYMTEARAMFADAQASGDARQFATSQDYFTRIVVMEPQGSEDFWEAWFRIIQSMEGQPAALSGGGAAEIKSHLGDLKTVYGARFGGEKWKDDFKRLAAKYQVP
ncbi:MAG TPA: hypothetical protein VGN88_05155, partial [Phycisphaerae bacterium]